MNIKKLHVGVRVTLTEGDHVLLVQDKIFHIVLASGTQPGVVFNDLFVHYGAVGVYWSVKDVRELTPKDLKGRKFCGTW